MNSHELARILLSGPDQPVEIVTENLVTPLIHVEQDCFDEEEGWVWLLTPDLDPANDVWIKETI